MYVGNILAFLTLLGKFRGLISYTVRVDAIIAEVCIISTQKPLPHFHCYSTLYVFVR